MSILTTRKFIVRGKSVDFRNREGSSPSIPKKGPLDSLIIFIPFSRFVNGSNFVIFLIYSILSQTYSGWISFHKSCDCDRYDTYTNEHLWAKQRIPLEIGIINNPNHYSNWNLRSPFFFSFYFKDTKHFKSG